MAFLIQNWARVSATANEPITTLQNGTIIGSQRFYNYVSLLDSQATMATANYFNPIIADVAVGDIIFVYSIADGTEVAYFVSAIAGGNVTISVFAAAGTIGTGNITNLAVTAAKIANNTITDTQVSVNGLSSLSLNKSLIQSASGTLSAANIAAMYGAPVQLIAAQGAHTVIVINSYTVELVYNTTAYTAGANFGLQYGNTANLGGPAASGQLAATSLTAGASTISSASGALTRIANANCVNAAIYISNITQAFATGDSTVNWNISYTVYTTS